MNNCTIAPLVSASELTTMALARLACDLEGAYRDVFAPRWLVPPISVCVGSPVGWRIEIVDQLDDPNDIAYHDVEIGRPVMRIGIDALRAYRSEMPLLDALTVAMGHELFEASQNPGCDRFIPVPGKTARLAHETVDPVQGSTWRYGETLLPNFVLPGYFVAEAMGPFDHLGKLVSPFSCSTGGYQVWDDDSQTFGERVPGWLRRHVRGAGRIRSAA